MRLFVVLLALLLAAPATAQSKKRIEKAADLPRFTYHLDGSVEELVRSDAKFAGFSASVQRDFESILAQYEIEDKSAERRILGVLAQLDFIGGRYGDAAKRALAIRALEDKPADKLISGQQLLAMVAAQKKAGDITSQAYRDEVGRLIAAELRAVPYGVIENNVKGAKSSAEIIGESLVLGNVREVLQPVVSRAGGAVSSELAPGIVSARYALVARLPLKQTLIDVYSAYVAENKVEKPDIWQTRAAEIGEGRSYRPVTIAVWDSGVDTALFAGRVVETAPGQPAFLAFDRYAQPSKSPLEALPPELRARLRAMQNRIKGLSDARSNVDSPEAAEVKRLLSTLKPDEYKAVVEEISLAGNYVHGTHVAGIAVAGNPHARILNARLEFDYHLLPDPCPSKAITERIAKSYGAYVDFMKAQRARVVNMSWSGSVGDYENQLELCGIGKTTDERKAMARELFEIEKAALMKALAGAADILFVAAAGNANQNASFAETIPADFVLPNLLTVGAVDLAGDETSFTSYGPTVKVHANGYQVDSFFPGGDRVALSGTSMASPQVANLAAKILVVNPLLRPSEVIRIIVGTAEKTSDGRRALIHPANAVAAARSRSQ